MDAKLLFIYEMIEALGVTIEYCVLPEDRDGEYVHEDRVIRVQFDLSTRVYRSTLAHECCHAVFADVPSRFGPVKAKQERRADEWAALRLIELEEYRLQEAQHDGHVEAMAVALNVTVDIVEAFQRVLIRVGDKVYTGARLGADQFLNRTHIA